MATKKSPAKVRVISSKTVFHGPVFSVTVDEVVEPSGVRARRDAVRHPGSIVVLVVDDTRKEPRVLLLRQYRYPANDRLWELSAGRIDAGESELAAAKRELLEETGFIAKHWKHLFTYYSSPGFMDETMAIYEASGLTPGKAQPEEDEVIQKRFFPLRQALGMIASGKICDGKTIVGLLWLERGWRTRRRSRP
ncbi:MAG: NUDIX hydrolase [Acidobacteriia bacterium]|nr:NUDIX hydrolase [Terriglobia bacterium]